MRYLLNSPVMTNYGRFAYKSIQEHEAIDWLETETWESAIGHESTAHFMTERLGSMIPFQRKTIRMRPGDQALVLRIMSRLPQDWRPSKFDIQRLTCEFGIIDMID